MQLHTDTLLVKRLDNASSGNIVKLHGPHEVAIGVSSWRLRLRFSTIFTLQSWAGRGTVSARSGGAPLRGESVS